ncbi:unnamed protein product [Acanthosepion pharaonis]|uniref:Uncharacterized protein n=1 Tax=Acanthosepion pharaonis TaxID=158019 RepID=A0A812CG88_ACAPH|nr:unnamed protein product [Sepia pharaonis]
MTSTTRHSPLRNKRPLQTFCKEKELNLRLKVAAFKLSRSRSTSYDEATASIKIINPLALLSSSASPANLFPFTCYPLTPDLLIFPHTSIFYQFFSFIIPLRNPLLPLLLSSFAALFILFRTPSILYRLKFEERYYFDFRPHHYLYPFISFRLTCSPLSPHLLSSIASPAILFRPTCNPLPPQLLSSSVSTANLFHLM